MLSILQYELLNKKMKTTSCNDVVNYFAPIAFEKLSYPTKIRNRVELIKYADTMHELRYKHPNIGKMLKGGVTLAEKTTLFNIYSQTANAIYDNFHTKIPIKNAPMLMIFPSRYFWAAYKEFIEINQEIRIFEIGPGCGYLAPMLFGYCKGADLKYCATDVTQAFYLYQNYIWNKFFSGDVDEILTNEDIDKLFSKKISHMPWWITSQFYKLQPVGFDCVIINNVLCEMPLRAAQFYLKFIKLGFLASKNNKLPKLLIISGYGYPDFECKISEINNILKELGFKRVINNGEIIISMLEIDCLNNAEDESIEKVKQSINENMTNLQNEISISFEELTTSIEAEYGENLFTEDEKFINFCTSV